MRFRAALLVVAAFLGFFTTTGFLNEPAGDPEAIDRYRAAQFDETAWVTSAGVFTENVAAMRENRTSVWNQYYRLGPGPDIAHSQFPQPEPANTDRIRVLVVGDSYVWGHGYDEPSMRWPALLEAELNARTAPGSFEVIAQGRNNFSAFGQADWFTADRIDALDPDVFVLGYFENDIFPSYTEPSICPATDCEPGSVKLHPAYRECLSGERGLTSRLIRHLVQPFSESKARSMLERHCDPDRIARELDFATEQEIYADPRRSPYWEAFMKSYARLADAVGDRPLLLFETPLYGRSTPFEQHLAGPLTDAGYRIVPRTATESLLDELTRLGPENAGRALTMISPADGHASPLLGAAFASDTAAEILASLPEERVRAASRRATAPLRTLIDATHPAPVTVAALDENRAVVTFTPRTDGKPVTATPEGDLPPQSVPCLSLGAPYLQLTFDPHLAAATKLSFRFDSASATPRELFGYGYDDRQQLFNRSLGKIRAGETMKFTAGDLRGLRLASVGQSCALDRAITAPVTTITLTRG